MPSTTFTVRVESDARKRRVHERQVAGIKQAAASLDAGRHVAHDDVKAWVSSWGSRREQRPPKPRKT